MLLFRLRYAVDVERDKEYAVRLIPKKRISDPKAAEQLAKEA